MDGPLLVRLGLDRVLADAVDRGQVVALHGVEHAGQVPAAPGRDRHAPLLVELRSKGVVLDVLEAGQAVGQRAHVAAALDVVLAAERVDAAPIPPDVPGQQHERDERQDVVDRVVMLGDAKGPADHRLVGLGEGVGDLSDGIRGHAGLALGVGQRVRLHPGPIGLEAIGRVPDEALILEPGGDDLAAHGVRQRDVAADVEAQPGVRPLGAAGAAWVDGDQAGTLVDRLEHVMEEDRMRLAGIAAPEDDQIGVLDLTV